VTDTFYGESGITQLEFVELFGPCIKYLRYLISLETHGQSKQNKNKI
jgi:hypothetical protein